MLGAAFAGVAWPLLQTTFLPFVDYPQHLATVAAVHGQGEATWSRFFVVDYSSIQYAAIYLLSDLLAYVFGVDMGLRLVIVAGLAGLPLAVGAWLKANGRPALGGALAAGIALHAFVFWGFVSYFVSLPVAVLALAALARMVRVRDLKTIAAFGALALLCFAAHAQTYTWLAAACFVQLAAMTPAFGLRRTWGAAWRALLAAIPSAGAALWWVLRSDIVTAGMAGVRGNAAAKVQGAAAKFEPVSTSVSTWLQHSFGVYRDGDGERIALAFLLTALLLVILRGHTALARAAGEAEPGAQLGAARDKLLGEDAGSPPAGRPSLPNVAPECVLALTVAAYLLAPISYRLIEPINHRFLPLAFALVPALGPLRLPRLPSRALAGAALIAMVTYASVVHTRHFTKMDAEMGDLDEALQKAEPGRRLLGLIYDRDSYIAPYPTYLHSHQYYQVRRGGLATFSFAEFPISPLRYKDGQAPPTFVPRFEWSPHLFPKRYKTYADYFDYYLLRTKLKHRSPRFWPAGTKDPPEPVYEGTRWKLFRKKSAPEAVAPARRRRLSDSE